MIGLTISLGKGDYSIKSNWESGHGRYDILVIPKDKQKMAIILELKSIVMPKGKKDDGQALEQALDGAAQDALRQINNRRYVTDLKQSGITQICKIGLAFCGKHLKVHHEMKAVHLTSNPTPQ